MSNKPKKKAKAAKPAPAPAKAAPARRKFYLRKKPDADKQAQVAAVLAGVAGPKVALGGSASAVLAGALQTKTPHQVVTESCAAWYRDLARTHPRVVQTVAAMIGVRRMYAVAYRELQEAVAEAQAALHAGGPDHADPAVTVPVEFVDFAAQYAVFQASKPFDEHALMRGVADTVLPWLADVVDRHTEADQRADAAARAEAAERRRAAALPIGFKHTPAQEDLLLRRDRSLVLVGWGPAVAWLLDQAVEHVLAPDAELTVVRLCAGDTRPEDQHARLVRLPRSAWSGCANSGRDLARMCAAFVADAVGGPVDLLVADDLAAAHTAGFVERAAGAAAGDAHKRLRAWCADLGAGLLGAVPLAATPAPDLTQPEFEQLRTFADLRAVAVDDSLAADTYRITVGAAAAVFDVPRADVDRYARRTLLTA